MNTDRLAMDDRLAAILPNQPIRYWLQESGGNSGTPHFQLMAQRGELSPQRIDVPKPRDVADRLLEKFEALAAETERVRELHNVRLAERSAAG